MTLGKPMWRATTILVVGVFLLSSCTSGTDEPRTPSTQPSRHQRPDNISLDVMVGHLEALVSAAEFGGDRAAGSPGYEASVKHVVETLEALGYDVTEQSVPIRYFDQVRPASLRVIGGRRYEEGVDYRAMLYSASGNVRAPVQGVTFDRDPAPRRGPGCDPDAFEAFPSGAVALLRPGPCFFRDQVVNAQRAGAAAVIFSLPEWSRETGVLRPTLLDPDAIDVPVLGVTDEMGVELSRPGVRIALRLRTVVERTTASNVIADSPSGSAEEVVVLGGHLDSVIDGPGINDNGSGVAALLALAERLQGVELERKVRFAFWAAEESGLVGSSHYIGQLSDSDIDRLHLYLNFDMIASPNGVTYIYDPDTSELSEEIHSSFEAHFDALDQPHIDIDLEGRSDHGPFLQAGVPVGGIFTGAEELKTPGQAKRFGGRADAPMDHCYHRECDDLSNVDRRLMDRVAEAVYAVLLEVAT